MLTPANVLNRHIAEGAYGFVDEVRARDGRSLAMKKVLAQEKDMHDLVNLEINVLKQLNPHPNIVPLIASSRVDLGPGRSEYALHVSFLCIVLLFVDHFWCYTCVFVIRYYLLMEYCAGGTLAQYIEQRQHLPLPEPDVLRLFHAVVTGVNHMHAQRPPITHRDLKVHMHVYI